MSLGFGYLGVFQRLGVAAGTTGSLLPSFSSQFFRSATGARRVQGWKDESGIGLSVSEVAEAVNSKTRMVDSTSADAQLTAGRATKRRRWQGRKSPWRAH